MITASRTQEQIFISVALVCEEGGVKTLKAAAVVINVRRCAFNSKYDGEVK